MIGAVAAAAADRPHVMQHGAMDTSEILAYARSRPRLPWRPYILGLLTVPVLYVLLYLVLRACGVFHAYYSQGSWAIDGGTGIYVVDLPFLPAAIAEADLQNRLRLLPEPTGG
jgi:hypothetical protein